LLSGDFVLPKIFPGEDGVEGAGSVRPPEKPHSSSKKSTGAARLYCPPGRIWYGYAPYNPQVIEKLLLLLREYWNTCLVPKGSKDGKTPAERLGLAKG
jgi:hypothetical protein